MGVLWSRSSSPEFDRNAVIAIGAEAYFFAGGTSTPYTVYQDADETTPHTHPVETDGYGRWPAVYIPFGTYKNIIQTSGGTELFSADNIPNPAPFTDDFELDQDSVLNTGDIFFSFKNGTRTGAVRCNGRTIGNAASSATERANADCEDLFAFLWNNVANGQAAVSGGRGASAAADFAANKTITLPNGQGAAPVGYDDMGNTAGSLLDSAPVVSGGPTTAASILGANTHTLTEAQLPSHTHSFSATTGAGGSHTHSFSATTSSDGAHSHTISITDPGHTHTVVANSGSFINNAAGAAYGGGGVGSATNGTAQSSTTGITASSNSTGSHTHTISGTTGAESSHTHSVSGTTGTGSGSGSAHNNLGRSLLVTWLMRL
jgi:hypothetical protein